VAWQDAPLSPGDWNYEATPRPQAVFANMGQSEFVARCDGGRIALMRRGAAGAILVRTTFGERTLPAQADGDGATATLSANDGLLDQMAFSRGRFTIESAGSPMLIVPSWPELGRVIEDCRG
jgi:hypothetical protein